jgi:EamA-like transporter family
MPPLPTTKPFRSSELASASVVFAVVGRLPGHLAFDQGPCGDRHLCRVSVERGGWNAEVLTEHGGKGALACIATVQRHVDSPFPLRQPLKGIVYALYSVLLKRWSLPIPGWQSTYMQALCALAIMFPAFLATPVPLRQVNAETLPLIAYAGGLASVALPFLWIRGIERLGPSRCAIFLNLLPILTAVAAIVMLGEPVRSFDIIGGSVALVGVACAQIFRRPIIRRAAIALGKSQ